MRTATFRVCSLSAVLLLTLATPSAAEGPGAVGLFVKSDAGVTTLSLDGADPFHSTSRPVLGDRLIDVAQTSLRVALWTEVAPDGGTEPFYAISLDGNEMATVRRTSYMLELRHGAFDPVITVPGVETTLAARETANLYLVQFVTQPLEEYREAVTNLGGTVHKFIAGHAHFVEMTPDARDAVAALPFVRWVGPVHPAYKLEEEIRGQLVSGTKIDPRRYSIMLHERGPAAQDRVVAEIETIGGELHGTTPQGFRIEATLSLAQVRLLADLDDVMFIDRKGPIELDMDIVREIGGANHVETVAGFTGTGVRAEVADSEVDVDHPEWSAPPIIHVAGSDIAHGTSVYGILFAQGVDAQARGLIPDGVGIFAYSTGLLGGGLTRYQHTAELVDPLGPYRTVLQTNSTGDPQTSSYTTISAEMDDMLFLYDIVLTQSQSNLGSTSSRPQAWAKNIVACGAVEHYNTETRDDDCWCSTGSIGPAADGRIKPDLSFFYDDTYTSSAGGGYTEFGGTSGATPSVAGYFGLFFQMWSEEAFGNEVLVPGGTVFENRPHMTTAKAAMVNTASPWDFSGTTDDMTRVHQGWGMPDVQYLYDIRERIAFIDETEILGNMETIDFVAFVPPGEPALRATMVYADPMGTPGAGVHRINDLTLKLTSPSSVVYWGNNGLKEGLWSVPGGDANTIDTVENVFVQNPESGVWVVEVIASEINEDGHTETPELDADFALVVSGADMANCSSTGRLQLDRGLYACGDEVTIRVVDCDLNSSDTVVDTVVVSIVSTTEPGGESVVLTEVAPETADFRGTIPLDLVDAPGVLQVSVVDVVTAIYLDADDGQGGTDVEVQGTADVDCVPPVITNVQSGEISGRGATITWDTDEPADSLVTYGTVLPILTASVSDLVTAHGVELTGLDECTPHVFSVTSVDQAGNSATNDNVGVYHAFETGRNVNPTYPSTDTPIPIQDNTTHLSVIDVTDSKTVLDVKVGLEITHTFTGDLDITLISPLGTRVLLVADRGGSGENFSGTLFDDAAATPIGSGSAPFTGSFQPEQPLAGIAGENSLGQWQLEVIDDAGGDTGSLNSWTLELNFPAQACGVSATYGDHALEADVCSAGAGDSNSYWDTGEMIQFSLTVRNDGTDPLTGVTAQVTPLTPGVVMFDSLADVGDIPSDSSAPSLPPHFAALLPLGMICGQDVVFEVVIDSNEGSWTEGFAQIAGQVIPGVGVAFTEDFEATGIPSDWTIIDGFGDRFTWYTDNAGDPAGCANTNPAPPLAGNWAAVDSDCTGSGVAMDEELISPLIDMTGSITVALDFDHYFNWLGPETADVDVRSSLTGGSWVNVARWQADTSNPDHATLDITAQASNVNDLQIRWHYYDADFEWYWYVDNVVVSYTLPADCLMPECSGGPLGPPPIPDGDSGSIPLTADLLSVDGSQILLTWDDQCSPVGTNLLYGSLGQVSSLTLSGADCGIAGPHVWDPAPAGDLWFLLVTDDGAGTESSWGFGAAGERNGLAQSGMCGSTSKDASGTCP